MARSCCRRSPAGAPCDAGAGGAVTALDRFRGSLLGLAVGDAIGTTVEFCPRGSFAPLHDMVGGGPFRLAAGQWTDDTSMALCLAASLVERGRFDPVDQIERYCLWHEQGYQSSTGRCFDIGGCIMRLAPVPMFFFADEESAKMYSGESSRTTHGADDCVAASRLFGGMIWRALHGASKNDVLLGDAGAGEPRPRIATIADGGYRELAESSVRSGGYVVDTLEAALWCFARTDSFDAAVLRAANLGYDADTTAAVCGQLAGAFYGVRAIPPRWLARLAWRDRIAALADGLYEKAGSGSSERQPS